jgi:ParB family transcriptional regulator, chromosome partitioning protein
MPTVAVDQISIGANRRPVKDEKVAELIESIKTNGLLNPITIDQNRNLIAGLHRLTACKLLGLPEVECNIITCVDTNQSRLVEIDENLIRSELNALERAELWLERDRILDELGLRAQSGHRQSAPKKGEMISPLLKTTLELAKETGYTDRTFQHGKQIARNIAPEVKELIRPTELASSPTALLKVARAGTPARQQAEQAEQAAAQAQARQQIDESRQQRQIAAAARAQQKEQQILAFKAVAAEKAAKLAAKQGQLRPQPGAPVGGGELKIQPGDEWLLGRHAIYCGDTTDRQFISSLPSHAALVIATVASTWEHDYLIDEAKVVVVLRSAETLHDFCRHHQMPFQFGWISGPIYVAVCSRQPLHPLPVAPDVRDRGIEGIVAYVISAYTQPGNFVITPGLGQGEVLIACERMGRICFAGEAHLEAVQQTIGRWQNLTGKLATLA